MTVPPYEIPGFGKGTLPPSAHEAESFLEEVEDVTRLVDGLRSGKVSAEYVDRVLREKDEETAKNETRAKQAAEEAEKAKVEKAAAKKELEKQKKALRKEKARLRENAARAAGADGYPGEDKVEDLCGALDFDGIKKLNDALDAITDGAGIVAAVNQALADAGKA